MNKKVLSAILFSASCVVLNDEHRPHSALFAAYHRAEIGVKNIAAFYIVIHIIHTPPEKDSRRYRKTPM